MAMGNGSGMKRFAVFAILGPALLTMAFFGLVLPVAGLLEGQRIIISVQPIVFLYCVFPALVVALFDWVAQIIEVPYRPIGSAIAGWILAILALSDVLALPDVPGWFMAIGLLGAVPAFICSWVVLTIQKKKIANA